MGTYKDIGIVDGKPKYVIVDGYRRTINKHPSKEELRLVTKWNFEYNDTNTCDRCGINFDDVVGHPLRERKNGKETGRWICNKCYLRDDYIERVAVGHRRTGNLDPNSTHVKGDNSLELACVLYGWVDLNKKNDNYSRGTLLDCYDPKTGLCHQVQGRYYSSKRGYWPFASFKREWGKKYETMVCLCYNQDGNIVERIYKFPWEKIMDVKSITITKNPTIGRYNTPFIPQYEKHRVEDKDELNRANEIWEEIIKRNRNEYL